MAKAKTTLDDRIGTLRWPIEVHKFEQEPYVVVNLFTRTELRKLMAYAKAADYGNCVVELGAGTNKDQTFLNDDWQWAVEKIGKMAQIVNEECWFFNLWGIVEQPRIIRYSVGQNHAMHHDYNTISSDYSKVSVTVALNANYDGGQLRFLDLDADDRPIIVPGQACFFPAWRAHEVTPVTKGVRYALTCWVVGPPFV